MQDYTITKDNFDPSKVFSKEAYSSKYGDGKGDYWAKQVFYDRTDMEKYPGKTLQEIPESSRKHSRISIRLPEITTGKAGVQMGKFYEQIMLVFDRSNPAHMEAIKTLDLLYMRYLQCIEVDKNKEKLGFSKKWTADQGTDKPKPFVHMPKIIDTDDDDLSKNPTMFVRVNPGKTIKGKDGKEFTIKSKFLSLSGKEYSYKDLFGVQMTLVPTITFDRITKAAGNTSVSIELSTAVISAATRSNSNSRDLETIAQAGISLSADKIKEIDSILSSETSPKRGDEVDNSVLDAVDAIEEEEKKEDIIIPETTPQQPKTKGLLRMKRTEPSSDI
ncbi:MAG: hypothetical protein AAB966_00010 [Patescibacteria group bacterium]